eukprot:12171162-Alexandrium_andersonii.AAC.1
MSARRNHEGPEIKPYTSVSIIISWSGRAPGIRMPFGMRVANLCWRFVGSACARAFFKSLLAAW